MQKIELKFDQPEEIIDFVRIMNRYECDADVKYGSMVVDAKSIVGVLSLARSKTDRKSTRLNSSHEWISRMPSSA